VFGGGNCTSEVHLEQGSENHSKRKGWVRRIKVEESKERDRLIRPGRKVPGERKREGSRVLETGSVHRGGKW